MFLRSYSVSDLDKIFRHSVDVFEHLDQMLGDQSFINTVSSSYPYHNIKKKGNHYILEIALAGFDKNDIEIVKEGNYLRIEGKAESDDSSDVMVLHQGISNRPFKKTFILGDNMEIVGADFRNGKLFIGFEHKIPEKDKPKKIEIGSDGSKIKNLFGSVKAFLDRDEAVKEVS